MKNLKFQSVFDIIGPVMVGPSSSHTAGAVRIGKIVSAIFGDTPTEVEFQLFNSFAKTYRGHGTDMALAGITSAIPVDQVVDAMYQVGSAMPTAFRETAEGGLAATPKGKALAKEIFR